jgi:hypothetical protein
MSCQHRLKVATSILLLRCAVGNPKASKLDQELFPRMDHGSEPAVFQILEAPSALFIFKQEFARYPRRSVRPSLQK